MATAWLVTPAAALVGALACWLSNGVKALTGTALAGDGLIFVIPVAASGYMWWRARQQRWTTPTSIADWDASTNSVVPADVRSAAGGAKPPRAASAAQDHEQQDLGLAGSGKRNSDELFQASCGC